MGGTRKNESPARRAYETVLRLESWFDVANRWALIMGVSATVVVVFVAVIFRRFLGRPIGWSEEGARYLLLWTMFLSLGQTLAHGRFTGMEIVIVRLPRALREMSMYLRYLVVLVFAWVVMVNSLKLIAVVSLRGQVTAGLGFHMSHVYSAMPLGAAVLIVKTLLLALKRAVRGGTATASGDQELQMQAEMQQAIEDARHLGSESQ